MISTGATSVHCAGASVAVPERAPEEMGRYSVQDVSNSVQSSEENIVDDLILFILVNHSFERQFE